MPLSNRLVRLFGVIATLALVTGCELEPAHIDPPGRPAVVDPASYRHAPREARAVIRVRRSGDDERGIDVVRTYMLLRRRAGSVAFAPFNVVAAKDDEVRDRRERAFYDVSAIPGATYQYVAYALAERERMTFGNAGAIPARSPISRAFTAIAPRTARYQREGEPPPPPPALRRPPNAAIQITTPEHDGGNRLVLTFPLSPDTNRVAGYRALRAESSSGRFAPFSADMFDKGSNVEHAPPPGQRREEVVVPRGGRFTFQVWAVPEEGDAVLIAPAAAGATVASLYNANRTNVGIVLALSIVLTFFFLWRAQRASEKIFIRRIPGVDAIEEAVGRATEMGRPVLYVPGIDEIQNIQTIASILILGRIAELIARYDSEIRVPCCIPLVAAVSQEVVRQGFYDAGRPDAYRPQNIQWISSEQFAFCAGTNGIMLRDKPATNIFLGRFFAESLILAETGYVNRAIQIAGTAEITQLPFFIAACDYTLIGEELFAVSAYMTREPRLLSTLKAADWIKALVLVVLVIGAVAAVSAPDGGLTQWLLGFLKPGE